MLNTAQIRWASQHVWFVCDNNDGTIDVQYEGERFQFVGSHDDLVEWAEAASTCAQEHHSDGR